MPATAEAVALGHLATHGGELAVAGELPEDSADSQRLELLKWGFSSARRCRRSSYFRDMLTVDRATTGVRPIRSTRRPRKESGSPGYRPKRDGPESAFVSQRNGNGPVGRSA